MFDLEQFNLKNAFMFAKKSIKKLIKIKNYKKKIKKYVKRLKMSLKKIQKKFIYLQNLRKNKKNIQEK